MRQNVKHEYHRQMAECRRHGTIWLSCVVEPRAARSAQLSLIVICGEKHGNIRGKGGFVKVTRVKICGMENPIGYGFRKIKVSWTVEEFCGRRQEHARIEVSDTPAFERLIYCKEGRELKQHCEVLDMVLAPRKRYYCRVIVRADNGDVAVSDTCFFETGKRLEPWEASWICTEKTDTFHPVFFKDFQVEKPVCRARVYISGLGVYEAYMNGKKLGDEYLAPFYNDYVREVQYQTYEAETLLEEQNRFEIYTGNGWYKGRFGLMGKENIYGDHMSAVAELHLDYEDGTHGLIKTDDTWSYRPADVEDSGIYDGETLNRRQGEKQPVQARRACLESEVYRDCVHYLTERFSVPVRVCERLPVQEIIQTPAGELVLDFGQNFTGYVSFDCCLPAGTKITLEYGEILQQGNFYNDNYRSATHGFVYISDGRQECVRPHFTFFAGRYVRVSGWPEGMVFDKEAFTGCVVHSDLEQTGWLKTSDSAVNQLISNCLWGQRSNFLDVPTDCPQRDERLGWTGDAQAFAPTACYNMDARAFFDKYLHDLRVAQEALGGSVPHFAPLVGTKDGGSSVWGDAATFIPAVLYEYFGDEEMLETYYPMMKDWVDYITAGDVKRGQRYLFDFDFTFGDWLALDGMTDQSMKGGTDDAYVSSCYYYASAKKVAKAARVLKKDEDAKAYEALAGHIRQAILDEYFTATGRLAIDTQTAYIVALKFGLWTDKKRLVDGLRRRFEKDAHKIKGGFVGATMMCRVLAENGLEDEAWHMLFDHEFPGWLHCVDLGATTIWERWNSVLDDGSISGTGMNSLNHYAYGSVVEYIYRNIAGIAPKTPGFTSAVLAPEVNWRMKFMNASYMSASGRYVSNWRLETDGRITVHLEVPFNCTATVILPGYEAGAFEMEAGVFDLTYMPDQDFRKMFTMKSRLKELAASPKAVEILRRELPGAAGMIASGNIEDMNRTLADLGAMTFMGFDCEAVARAGKEICELLL